MVIIGAGMAGLIAAHFFRHLEPTVYEGSPAPTDNHGALLRFRSKAVADITGVHLDEVMVRKAIIEPDMSLVDRCSLFHSNSYSRKVVGSITDRSISNLDPVRRWIARTTFMEELRRGIKVVYGRAPSVDEAADLAKEQPVISTAPLQFFTNKMPEFQTPLFSQPIFTIETILAGVNVNQTVYVPWLPNEVCYPFADCVRTNLGDVYRASVIGSRLVIEGMLVPDDYKFYATDVVKQQWAEGIVNDFCRYVLGHAGISKTTAIVKVQKRGKIEPLEQNIRRQVVSEITERFGAFSLGRFATWRNILLDDVVDDLGVIRRLLESGRYGRSIHYAAT